MRHAPSPLFLVGVLVAASSCIRRIQEAMPRTRSAQPLPSILSPAPPPRSGPYGLTECPIGFGEWGEEISASVLVRAMDGHLPRWLPRGFGLFAAWRYESPGARATWTNRRCREFTLGYSPSGTPEYLMGSRVGAWTLTESGKGCGNAVLGSGRCLVYELRLSTESMVVQALGLSRRLGDRVVLSIPL
jgi:hypothetical protein